MDVNESSLLLELYDHDLVGADDALAQLVLPLSQLPKARDGDRASAPVEHCLLYTSPSPRDRTRSRMPSSA